MTSSIARADRKVTALCVTVLAASSVLSLGGCGVPEHQLEGYPDQVSQAAEAIARTYERLEAMDEFVYSHNPTFGDGEWNVVGSYYTLIQVDNEPARSNLGTIAMMGNPATVAFQQAGKYTRSDIFHPAGSDWDYSLLGPEYRELAPTPWVGQATALGKPRDPAGERRAPYDLAFCWGSSLALLCGVRVSIFNALIDPKVAPSAHARVVDMGDGVTELRMLIPFTSLGNVDDFPNFPALFPSETVEELMEGDLGDLPFLVRLWQNEDGEPIKAEVNGEVTDGESTVTLQAGWEKTGESTAADFPRAPSALDITYLTQEQGDELLKGMDRIGQRLREERE
ncbi:MAG: hypothetical protein LBJ02_12110 [Bifidobacteriaceae bacterium]|jgi:hypothetical protein|nr:hypothetical protein [Bifidobacteriaceae bacterium]